ncbi:MAG: HAD-IA family hydrolase [Myxococcales bacterium]
MPAIAIFDFDGTLADSLDVVIDEYNRLAPRFRVKAIDRRQLPRLRTLGGRAALREHDVSLWKLPFLAHTMRRALRAHVAKLSPVHGIVDALRALELTGCRFSILSTNSEPNIAAFLRAQDLRMFQHIAGSASMFGKGAALKQLIKRARYDGSRVFYVGDEVRDISAARAAGVRSIAVGWGYAQRDALLAQNPDHLVDTPQQLVDTLSSAR